MIRATKKGGRYDISRLVEAQFEPHSRRRVLRNLLGVRQVREMHRLESEALLSAQELLVETFAVDHRFTADDVCRIHHTWLVGIYSWAGEYRSVNVSKGNFLFAAAAQVPRLMRQLEQGALKQYSPCRFAEEDEIARAIAVVHAEVVLIHPFRDGNGRCARLLALLMALQAGLPPLDFSDFVGRGKLPYIAAVHAAVGRDYKPMTQMFSGAVRRTLRHYGRSRGL